MALIFVKNPLPCLSAVPAHKDAALLVGTEGMTHSSGVDDIRLAGIDDNAGNVLCFIQPPVAPCFSAVRRFINAAAKRDRVPDIRLSCADIDDVMVLRLQSDVANG